MHFPFRAAESSKFNWIHNVFPLASLVASKCCFTIRLLMFGNVAKSHQPFAKPIALSKSSVPECVFDPVFTIDLSELSKVLSEVLSKELPRSRLHGLNNYRPIEHPGSLSTDRTHPIAIDLSGPTGPYRPIVTTRSLSTYRNQPTPPAVNLCSQIRSKRYRGPNGAVK